MWSTLDKEIPELEKNTNSNYIIHNYGNGPNVLDQINHIDTVIINTYIENDKKSIKKTQVSKNVTLYEKEENIFNSLVSQNMRFLQ